MAGKMIVRSGHLSRPAKPPGEVENFQQGWSLRSLWHLSIPRRWIKMLILVGLVCFFSLALGLGLNQSQVRDLGQDSGFQDDDVSHFPPPRQTGQKTHDPTILKVGNEFYLYNVGEHIYIHTAPSMAGPWKHVGSVLDANSVIPKGDRAVPWAPTVIEFEGVYYCYYSVSKAGCRDSAVGVATSNSPGPGKWHDHGAVVQTGTGNGSDVSPYTISNAIDPSALVLPNGEAYLTFGSYWTGIYQVPLGKDMLSPKSTTQPDARHLAYEPNTLSSPNRNANSLCGDPTGPHAIEGAFISHRDGYYYLWFSHGNCCNLHANNLPAAGKEYVFPRQSSSFYTNLLIGIAFALDGPRIPVGPSSTRAARTWLTVAAPLSMALMAKLMPRAAKGSYKTATPTFSTIIIVSTISLFIRTLPF